MRRPYIQEEKIDIIIKFKNDTKKCPLFFKLPDLCN